ncbi:phosphomannomutase isoform X1 [Myzus persicae]|uniref:phosphomannomutase isoform X1 n=1 Tax=Myzus persicae TaxID=13164 RepID=UPI000B93758A|nr:phosphomannomutase isoform X1 [Myzus persicae]
MASITVNRLFSGTIKRACSRSTICLFDVDGTVTDPRQPIDPSVRSYMIDELKKKTLIGLVSGSDISKIEEQLGGPEYTAQFDYVFAENGLVAFKNGAVLKKQTIVDYLGEEKLQTFINFALGYMSKIQLPVKRGNFVEFRTGMINISPVGRSCSKIERDNFEEYDNVHNIRKKFIESIKENLPDIGLTYSIGGQISFDCFPIGWDKRFCLRYVEDEFKDNIYFFGDKTFVGGNDHEIFNDPRVIGHTVINPEDTISQLNNLFNK